MRALVGGAMLLLAACLVVGWVAEPPRGAPARVTALAGERTGEPTVGPASPAGPAPTALAPAPAALAPPPAALAAVAWPTSGNAALVDAAWAAGVGASTGIPLRAVAAYAGAALALADEQPACHLGWNTLAALGEIESAQGTHGGASIGADGTARPGIFGPDLDGGAYANVADSDGGALDASAGGDRAVGPLQFIPSTWQRWGADGNGDGRADPQQLDDAALAAGRYLCSYGDLSTVAGWRASVFAYNHLESYVDQVAVTANRYVAEAG